MTLPHPRANLLHSLMAFAGLTSPLTLALIILALGNTEVGLAQLGFRRFGISDAGLRLIVEAVYPCLNAIVCAAAFGIPLGLLIDGQVVRCWAIFVIGAVVAHAISALFVPPSLSGFWEYMGTMLLPFWWLFFATLLGFFALTSRLRTRIG
jgi:hypothetical protein